MFGLGHAELLIILAIVLIMFGPAQLPKLAKLLGDSFRSLKRAASGEDTADSSNKDKDTTDNNNPDGNGRS